MIRALFVGTSLLALSSILLSPSPARGEEDAGIVLDAALTGGVRLLDIEGETYELKTVPVLGVSFFPCIRLTGPLFLSVEVSFSYTFRSDNIGLYYYDAFGSAGIMPEIGLLFPGNGVDWALFMGGGVHYSFSEYDTGIHPAVAVRVGAEFKESFLKGIFLSYSHRFVNGFQTHESFALFASTRLYRFSHHGRG